MTRAAQARSVIGSRVAVSLAVAVCAALLAACGGGGGDEKGASDAKGTTSTTGPTTTTTAPAITYTVQRGDTLTTISKKFGVPISVIVATNKLANPDQLTEGQTLTIPPTPPVQLVITPPSGNPGSLFQFELTGAKPQENVTFEITSPNGKFTGPPHTVGADGVVKAAYRTEAIAVAGTYTVVAKGSAGTTAQATFTVAQPGVALPTTTSTP